MRDKALRLSFRDVCGMIRNLTRPMPEFGELYRWFTRATPIQEVEPGWFLLQWAPVRGATYNLYLTRYGGYETCFIRAYETGARNGWGRSYEGVVIEIYLPFRRLLTFWIRWNIVVMAEGPGDWKEPMPLDPKKIEALRGGAPCP